MAAGDRDQGHSSARPGPMRSTRSSPRSRTPGRPSSSSATTTSCPDGSAMLCTMQGDVWHVTGLDDDARARPVAAVRLGPPPGARAGRGRRRGPTSSAATRSPGSATSTATARPISTRCVSNAYATSTAGHDFICGLQRDAQGRFYTASGPQGVIRISADGKSVETLATGFRNPDGIGLGPDGTITVPSSEGEWVPTSMVAEIRPGAHYGYPGPEGQPAARPPPGLPPPGAGQLQRRPGLRRRRPLRAAGRPAGSTPRSAPGRSSCCSATPSTASRRGRWSPCPASSSPESTGPG